MTDEQHKFIEARLQDGLTLRQIFKDPACTLSRQGYYRQPVRLEVPKRKPTRLELLQVLSGLVRDIEVLNFREECVNYARAKDVLE